MTVSAVGNAYSSPQAQAVQRTPESAKLSKLGGDNDGASDEGGGRLAQAAAKPTVNLNGQTLGQLINVIA